MFWISNTVWSSHSQRWRNWRVRTQSIWMPSNPSVAMFTCTHFSDPILTLLDRKFQMQSLHADALLTLLVWISAGLCCEGGDMRRLETYGGGVFMTIKSKWIKWKEIWKSGGWDLRMAARLNECSGNTVSRWCRGWLSRSLLLRIILSVFSVFCHPSRSPFSREELLNVRQSSGTFSPVFTDPGSSTEILVRAAAALYWICRRPSTQVLSLSWGREVTALHCRWYIEMIHTERTAARSLREKQREVDYAST